MAFLYTNIFCILVLFSVLYKFYILFSEEHGPDTKASELLKLRALGWSQSYRREIEHLSTGYQLSTEKLKEQSKKNGTDEVFNAALIGGVAGAAAGIGIVALLELLKETKN